ncbi:MAG TPA: prevent-host-death protein [Streptosporangiaceae bacterium]|nr:prevent-host-death protein [Streptosporangiaceae bacterium]
MTGAHYDSYTEARTHLKDLLDAAARGRPATVCREHSRAAVVDADRFRRYLAGACRVRAELVAEAGGWSVFLPGHPIAADGSSFDEAITEMVDAMREYAVDWQDHLLDVPNHRDAWALVQLTVLSSDDQLRAWLTGVAS